MIDLQNADLIDLISALNSVLYELRTQGNQVTAYELKSPAGPNVMIILPSAALLGQRVVAVAR